MDDDINSSNFFDELTSHLFVPHIIHPTRITPSSKTLIDNIFSNSTNYQEGFSGNFTFSLSDHLAQFLIIPDECHHTAIKMKQPHHVYDLKGVNIQVLLDDLILNPLPDIKSSTDPNKAFVDFHTSFNSFVDKHIKKRKLTPSEVKQKYKPWISKDILKMINKRNRLHSLYIKTKDNNDLKQRIHIRYKTIRNEIVSAIRQSKKEHFQNFFSSHSNNLRKTWRGIKSIININKKGKGSPESLLVNDDLITDPAAVANEFNSYFSNVARKLQNSIYSQGKFFKDYLVNPSEKSFFIIPTNKVEIIEIINDNIKNKASGPNSIHNLIFHLLKDLISESLADIINLSFSTGIYIDKLKISKIVPIFKDKGEILHVQNYRPISLLSNINKIFEKLMHKRLISFLETQGLIYESQFGFRKQHSTTHALTDLTEAIRKAIDSNKFACGVFVDLAKAFDTVDHNILLKKLEHYGIRGIANAWFHSYLENNTSPSLAQIQVCLKLI